MKGVIKMNRLKELRKEKKLSQKEIADILGFPLRSYQRMENGESQIKPDKAQVLADFFGVSVGYLLGYSEFRNEENLLDKVEETDFFGDAELSTNDKKYYSDLDISLTFALLKHHQEEADFLANQIIGAYIQKDTEKRLSDDELKLIPNILKYTDIQEKQNSDSILFFREVLGLLKSKYDH